MYIVDYIRPMCDVCLCSSGGMWKIIFSFLLVFFIFFFFFFFLFEMSCMRLATISFWVNQRNENMFFARRASYTLTKIVRKSTTYTEHTHKHTVCFARNTNCGDGDGNVIENMYENKFKWCVENLIFFFMWVCAMCAICVERASDARSCWKSDN